MLNSRNLKRVCIILLFVVTLPIWSRCEGCSGDPVGRWRLASRAQQNTKDIELLKAENKMLRAHIDQLLKIHDLPPLPVPNDHESVKN